MRPAPFAKSRLLQLGKAALDGWIGEEVTIPRFEPTPNDEQARYVVKVYIKPDDSHVEVLPQPPSVRERGQALLAARRILQEKEGRTATVNDRQMLMQAIINLTREIDALP